MVIGARSAAWAPCPDLAAVVVLDEHDEALQEERSPTWHARDVVVERARRAGAPALLVSPCPTVAGLAAASGRLTKPSIDAERDGWPIVEVVDRRRDEPWRTSLVTSPLIAHLRRSDRTVVCVHNTPGRARILACRSCHALARCERCDAAVGLADDGTFVCRRCDAVRPAVCLACGGSAFANLKPGVTRLREELEAAAGRPVVAVTGRDDEPPPAAGVYVGTEAVLHRVTHADVVAFLDIDIELLAPRYRAAEQALALLVRGARLIGPRRERPDARLLVQTFLPRHDVIQAALLADPGRLAEVETARRRELDLPPFAALAAVSGPGSDDVAAALREHGRSGRRRGSGPLSRAGDDLGRPRAGPDCRASPEGQPGPHRGRPAAGVRTTGCQAAWGGGRLAWSVVKACESLAGEVVELSALAGGFDGVGGLAAVEVGFAVVRLAFQVAVGFGGDPAVGVGDAVVDVAVGDRLVAAGGVLAVPVAHLDGAAQHPAEGALLGCGDDLVGAVEDERLHLGPVEVGDDQAGVDDGAGGQLTEPFEGGFTGEDADQRFGAAPVGGDGLGTHGHFDQRRGHPFTHGADHPVTLVLAVQVAFDPP